MNTWVCLVKGESGQWITDGPLTDAELKTKIAKGELSLKSWVWRRGLKRWTMVSELKVANSASRDWSYEPELRESEVQFAELTWTEAGSSEPPPPGVIDYDLC